MAARTRSATTTTRWCRLGILLVLVAGCGRINYARLQDDAGIDASAPDAGPDNCASAALPYASGDGSTGDPFRICTPDQLAALTHVPRIGSRLSPRA